MDNWNKFNESVPLEKDKYYTELTRSSISDKDLKDVEKVCNNFKIRDLGIYHDLYVQPDTLLPKDVFEAFRKTCIKAYELDPTYFVSLPGFAWTAMLKSTKVELELLTDKDMLLMLEEGTRGGISQAIHKCAKANNKYMKSYNNMIMSSYIQYLDANNLYGWAMCRKLLIGGFKWANIEEYTEEKIKNYNNDRSTEALLKVDVGNPKELHKNHRYLPFFMIERN